MRLIRSATLVAVLLLAQAAVATHVDFEDSHPAGEVCALCAGQAALGAGNVGLVVAPYEPARAEQPAALLQSPVSRFHHRFFLARGPPAVS
jgi:hypothetical protein